MVCTAYDAMLAVLNCNETIEALKSVNNDNMPDLLVSKLTTMLTEYRELLVSEMQRTSLEVLQD